MVTKENRIHVLLDEEWIDLVLEALDSGISEEDIKAFLTSHSR
ncbi:anti-repressor SinI family protein [Bacillus songklensis]|uniref:Anti-repressor SinI family protein n=1 Tax=Bacillus songklensis TaxID=1069116 RepID=A0ABV8B592_9BACI